MLWRSLLSGDLRSAFITLALSLPAIVLCLSVHEAAHGGVAYLLGDRTARDSGRLTLSPLAHIDPIGFLCLLLFGFGWARPVPVNISNFKNRRTGMAATALAGPAANFVTAFVAYCLYFLVWAYGGSVFMQVVGEFLLIVASMSVGLGVFNLIPVHPLDGSRVLEYFLPARAVDWIEEHEQVIYVVFMVVILFTPILDRPLSIASSWMYSLLNWLTSLVVGF